MWAGNLKIHRKEGPQALIKRAALQLPENNRPSSTEQSGTWVQPSPPPHPRGVCMVPAFLVTSLSKGRRTTGPPGPMQKSLLRDMEGEPWAPGPDLFQQISRIDSQDCCGRANLVTANAGEPAAGTPSGFCYTRTQLVAVFAITDLAFIQEEHTTHPAAPCFC